MAKNTTHFSHRCTSFIYAYFKIGLLSYNIIWHLTYYVNQKMSKIIGQVTTKLQITGITVQIPHKLEY
jgi:hypothetical protein